MLYSDCVATYPTYQSHSAGGFGSAQASRVDDIESLRSAEAGATSALGDF